jgi:hypothetical protein
MTRAEWDREFWACLWRRDSKGYDPPTAQRKAREITTARYGQQPPNPPLWLRVALKIAGRKLAGLRPTEEKTMKQRLVASALFGAAAVIAALQINVPNTKQGWVGLAVVFISAAWGKFSSNQTLVAPNRPVWTETQRELASTSK